MSDNKNLKGQQDRNRVAGNEDYELEYIAKDLGVSTDMIQKAIAAVGNNRQDIEVFIKNNKA